MSKWKCHQGGVGNTSHQPLHPMNLTATPCSVMLHRPAGSDVAAIKTKAEKQGDKVTETSRVSLEFPSHEWHLNTRLPPPPCLHLATIHYSPLLGFIFVQCIL